MNCFCSRNTHSPRLWFKDNNWWSFCSPTSGIQKFRNTRCNHIASISVKICPQVCTEKSEAIYLGPIENGRVSSISLTWSTLLYDGRQMIHPSKTALKTLHPKSCLAIFLRLRAKMSIKQTIMMFLWLRALKFSRSNMIKFHLFDHVGHSWFYYLQRENPVMMTKGLPLIKSPVTAPLTVCSPLWCARTAHKFEREINRRSGWRKLPRTDAV